MEKQANTKRVDFTFKVGDLVLLKVQPYRQTTVANQISHNLSKRFFGPFRIIKRNGSVAYMLDLPSLSQIHPVVHISLLRPYHGEAPSSTSQPSPESNLIPFLHTSSMDESLEHEEEM